MLVGETDEIEQRPNALFDRALVHAGYFERQRDVSEHGARGQQVEVLEDHADGAAKAAQRRLVEPADIDAVNQHLAARRLFEPVDQSDQRRLASAGAADDAGDRTTVDGQRDLVERSEGAAGAGRGEMLGNAVEDDGRVSRWRGVLGGNAHRSEFPE